MSHRTPLTDDQYSELVNQLEAMRSAYSYGYVKQPQQMLRDMHTSGVCSGWALIYLTQWFGIVGQDSAHIPHMVAELCKERVSACRTSNAACV